MKDERTRLERPRARRDAAKMLGVALSTRYRKFLDSSGDEDATVVATADLAQCMYENVEFIIWALKHLGGLNPPPPEELRRITPPNDNDRLQKEMNKTVELPCTCPPHDARLIGYKHMASCPKFVPA